MSALKDVVKKQNILKNSINNLILKIKYIIFLFIFPTNTLKK